MKSKKTYLLNYEPGQMILIDFGSGNNLRLLLIVEKGRKKENYLVYEAWCSIQNQVNHVGTSYWFNFESYHSNITAV